VLVGRSPDYLTVAQFDLLGWVSRGCEAGVYKGPSHRVSVRALHNRGLVRVEGRGPAWTAVITAEGSRLLAEQARRAEAVRERERREEQARTARQLEQQRLRTRALQVLGSVLEAGGRLDIGTDISQREIEQIAACLAEQELLPHGQRLAHESLRMDPGLGVSVYLEPDFAALTPLRAFTVPRQLRSPHPRVTAFTQKRQHVSRPQIGRAARFLQGLVLAAAEMGWKVPAKTPAGYGGRDETSPDLAVRLPSCEVTVTICELDQRGRPGSAFVTRTDYYTRAERTTANISFAASGRLEAAVSKTWDARPILTLRDSSSVTLEEQLPVLVHVLETGEAEARWAREEKERRDAIRTARWEEVRAEALVKLAYEHNAHRLRDELDRRSAAAAMTAYADEITAHAATLGDSDAAAAREWVGWIRRHAEATNPLNGLLHVLEVTSSTYDELQPHMNGWSAHGPYRHQTRPSGF
jgi:hypothetical protein